MEHVEQRAAAQREDRVAERLRDHVRHAQELARLAQKLHDTVRKEHWEELEQLIQQRGALLEQLRDVPASGDIGGSEVAERLRRELSALLRTTFLQDRATKDLLDEKVHRAAEDVRESQKGLSLVRTYRKKGTKGTGTWLDFWK
jgi:hypothetical protein